jgi:phage terminase large subunit-like protein
LHRYATGDFAVTEKTTADFTAFGDWGIDANNHWWLLDIYHEQSESTDWVGVLAGKKLETGHISAGWFKSKPLFKFIGEGGVIRRAVEPWLKKTMREHQQYCSIEWINRTHDKIAMAASFKAMCRAQVVHFPMTPDGDKVVEELIKFNTAPHDDLVDMCAQLGLAVDQGIAATAPEPKDLAPKFNDYGINEPDVQNIKLL